MHSPIPCRSLEQAPRGAGRSRQSGARVDTALPAAGTLSQLQCACASKRAHQVASAALGILRGALCGICCLVGLLLLHAT